MPRPYQSPHTGAEIDQAVENAAAAALHIADESIHVTPAKTETWDETGADLTAHMQDKTNPHDVTAAQVGAAPVSHTHTASQVPYTPSTGMTATNVQGALDAIADSVYNMRRLATGANLDTITAPGNYYSLNSSDTASLVNCPFSGSGGKIRVETITPIFVMQTAIKGWSATTPSISVRGGQLASGVWGFSPWYRVELTPMA